MFINNKKTRKGESVDNESEDAQKGGELCYKIKLIKLKRHNNFILVRF